MISVLRGVPIVLSPHGSLDPYLHSKSSFGLVGSGIKKIYHLLFQLIVPRISFHFTADDEKKLAAKAVPFKRSFVIPIGVPLPPVQQSSNHIVREGIGSLDSDFIFGYIGRFHHKKNILNVIKSFHGLHSTFPRAWLVLIGPNGDTDYMKLLIDEADIGVARNRIIFLGPVSHDLIPCYLADIDIYVLPSYSENFGIAILEAMASQKPVIVSHHVNIHHLISAHNAGLVVGTDVEGITSAMLSILSLDPGDRTAMGNNGRALVEREFSPDIISKRYISAYLSVSCN